MKGHCFAVAQDAVRVRKLLPPPPDELNDIVKVLVVISYVFVSHDGGSL